MAHTHTGTLSLYKPDDDEEMEDSRAGFNSNSDILGEAVIGVAGILTMAHGGSAKALTASNGGIVYTDADSMEILAGTATALKLLFSQANAAPIWSTPTYPNASGTSGFVMMSDGTNFVSQAQSNIDHNALTNYSANRHIDHTAVSIIDGNGITGGGDLSASRTLALTALTSDWDIGDGRMIQADKIRARDGDGLSLFEDGGRGISVADLGNVTFDSDQIILTSATSTKLYIKTTGIADVYPGITFLNSSAVPIGAVLGTLSGSFYFDYVGSLGGHFRIRNAIDGGIVFDIDQTGNVAIPTMTSAGFVKNAVTTGLLSGGNALAVADIPVMTSAEFATKISDETGTDKVVFNTSPTLVTPILGVAKANSINAPDGNGLGLYEDGGAGIFIKDGGNVLIGTTIDLKVSFKLAIKALTGNSNLAIFANNDFVSNTSGSGLAITTGAASGDTYTDLTAYALGYGALANLILMGAGGNVGVAKTAPTARLHLPASTASADTASLKIDAGVVATTPVTGNIESDGTHLYWTDSGGNRKQLDN